MMTITPRTVDVYYVFLASTNDLFKEREAVRSFFRSFNIHTAEDWGVRFQVIDWENYATIGIGRPQDLITKQTLEKYRDSLALLIGLTGRRLGGGRDGSLPGTIEEFHWAFENASSTGFPEIKWFFIHPRRDSTDSLHGKTPAEYTQVLKFRSKLETSEPPIFFRDISSFVEFHEVLTQDLTLWLRDPSRLWLQARLLREIAEGLPGRAPKQFSAFDIKSAPNRPFFFGRNKEKKLLSRWLYREQARLVLVVGLRGIGKTQLVINMAQTRPGESDNSRKDLDIEAQRFQYVIWRSLLGLPSLEQLLRSVLSLLSHDEEESGPMDKEDVTSSFFRLLEAKRCLIILDNLESLLVAGKPGEFRSGYHDYREFIRLAGEIEHQSCIIFTSREKPDIFLRMESSRSDVRTLTLRGLTLAAGIRIFRTHGDFSATKRQWKTLVDIYEGNPLALELAARHIGTVFRGNIAEFLEIGQPIFRRLRELLDWHWNRLGEPQKEVMYWLAINREPTNFAELLDDVLHSDHRDALASTIDLLSQQIPLSTSDYGFSLQPVLIEYLTSRLVNNAGLELTISERLTETLRNLLVERTAREIFTSKIRVLNNYALLKASAKSYVRDDQRRTILLATIERLHDLLGSPSRIEEALLGILGVMRAAPQLAHGYGPGNILNLLFSMKDLHDGLDLRGLMLRQVDFRHIHLRNSDLSNSRLWRCNFAQPLGSILSIAISEDGAWVATGDADNAVRVWSVERGQPVWAFSGHSNWVRCVAFNRAGDLLASGGGDGLIKLWSIREKREVKRLEGHTGWINGLEFSADGKTIASGSEDRTVRIWNIEEGLPEMTLTGHTLGVWQVRFDKTGEMLASCSNDGTIRLWDLPSRRSVATLRGHTSWVRSIDFNHDKSLLASGSGDCTIRLWSVRKKRCVGVLTGHSDWIWSVAFGDRGRRLVSGSEDRSVRVWDLQQMICKATLARHSSSVRSVAFSHDERQIFSAGEDQAFHVWDSTTLQQLETLRGYSNSIHCVASSGDGTKAAAGFNDRAIRIYNIQTGELELCLRNQKGRIWAVAFQESGKLFASGGSDRTLHIWNLETGKRIAELQGHTYWIRAIDFNEDGGLVASGSEDFTVRIWDTATQKCLYRLKHHRTRVFCISLSKNGRFLASAGDDCNVRLWSLETGKCLRVFHGHQDKIRGIAFDFRSSHVLSASEDGSLRRWNLDTGECDAILVSEHDRFWCCSAHSSEQLVAIGGDNGILSVLNSETGALIAAIETDGVLRSVAFVRGNSLIIAGGATAKLQIWDYAKSRLVASIRPDRPYEGLRIENISGLTKSQVESLVALGAVT